MRSAAFLLLTLTLVAFGCEAGALCAATAADAECCCPMMDGGTGAGEMAMGEVAMDEMAMGSKHEGVCVPCMEETGELPAPQGNEATVDSSASPCLAAPATAFDPPLRDAGRAAASAQADPAAGHGPALYLLGCSFLN